MVVVPSPAAGGKLLYVRHDDAEIGGDESWACRAFLWYCGVRLLYCDFGCRKPDQCTCTVCRWQPLLQVACVRNCLVLGISSIHFVWIKTRLTISTFMQRDTATT
jgi:hypothetical protein